MVIAICPKCNKKGTQSIQSDGKGSPRKYLIMVHKNNKKCYIGRIRSTEEAMGEFEKKATSEELSETLNAISGDIRNLIKSYSPNTAVRMHVISEKLIKILKEYGY